MWANVTAPRDKRSRADRGARRRARRGARGRRRRARRRRARRGQDHVRARRLPRARRRRRRHQPDVHDRPALPGVRAGLSPRSVPRRRSRRRGSRPARGLHRPGPDRVRRVAGARGGDDRRPVAPGRAGDRSSTPAATGGWSRSRRHESPRVRHRHARDHRRPVRRRQRRLYGPRRSAARRAARPRHAAAAADRDGARARRGRLGRASTGSRSASGPERSPGCGSGSRRARALARARSIPLVGVSTLQSLALAGPAASSRRWPTPRRGVRGDRRPPGRGVRRRLADRRGGGVRQPRWCCRIRSLPRRWPSCSRRSARPRWRSETGR